MTPRTRKKPAKAGKPARTRKAAPPARPAAYADFMAGAYAMEVEAAERYADFAEQLEMHNNPEVAQLFRKLSKIEALHGRQILEEMGWKAPPRAAFALRWDSPEAPETAPVTDLHYLMQPWHALQMALASEQRAEKFFRKIAAARATPAAVRKVALEMAADEREHVRLIREWMKKVDKPADDWDHDPDPARYGD